MTAASQKAPLSQLLTVMDIIDDKGPGLSLIGAPPNASIAERNESLVLSIERRAANIIRALRRKKTRSSETSANYAQLALQHCKFIREFCSGNRAEAAVVAAINAMNALWLADESSALVRIASNGGKARVQQNELYAIKHEVRALWYSRYCVKRGRAAQRTYKQFAGDMLDRWDKLKIRTVLEWCTQWEKDANALAKAIGKTRSAS